MATASLYLSGGRRNTRPAASLGGAQSSTLCPEALFEVKRSESRAGVVLYRCIYVKAQTLIRKAKVWVALDTPSAASVVALGWGATGANGVEPAIDTQKTKPPAVTFASPTSKDAAVAIGDLQVGDTMALWIRYTIAGTEAIPSETFTIEVDSSEAVVEEPPEELEAPAPAPAPVTGLVPVIVGGHALYGAQHSRLYGPGGAICDDIGNLYVDGEDCLSHRFAAKTSGNITAMRLYFPDGSGYAAGNGGICRVRIYPDDGSAANLPDMGVAPLATGQLALQMSGGKLATGFFQNIALSASAPLEAGKVYHAVFDNVSSSPASNWFSINQSLTLTANGPLLRWARTADWGSIKGTRSGSGISWVQDFSRKPHSGGYYYVPIMQVTVAGVIFGVTMIEGGNRLDESYTWRITSSTPVRERFTPKAGKRVVGFSVNTCAKVGGGLLVELKNGSTTLAARTISQPAANFAETGGWAVKTVWYDVAFDAPVELSAGVTYDLVFTPQGSSQWMFLDARDGTSHGFNASTFPKESFAQHLRDGTWLGAYHWNHGSSSNDAHWRVVLHLG